MMLLKSYPENYLGFVIAAVMKDYNKTRSYLVYECVPHVGYQFDSSWMYLDDACMRAKELYERGCVNKSYVEDVKSRWTDAIMNKIYQVFNEYVDMEFSAGNSRKLYCFVQRCRNLIDIVNKIESFKELPDASVFESVFNYSLKGKECE